MIWEGSAIVAERLSSEELTALGDPQFNHRLTLRGVVHDPHGQEPPPTLEVRLPWSMLADLKAQISALQTAAWHAGSRAVPTGEVPQEYREALREATSDSKIDASLMERVVVGLKRL